MDSEDGHERGSFSAEMIGILELVALPFLRRFSKDTDLKKYYWHQVKTENASYEDVLHLCLLEADGGGIGRFVKAIAAFREAAAEVGFSRTEIAKKVTWLRSVRGARQIG